MSDEDHYDCRGGPGTTIPACGACLTCVLRERDSIQHELELTLAGLERGNQVNARLLTERQTLRHRNAWLRVALEREHDDLSPDPNARRERIRAALQSIPTDL